MKRYSVWCVPQGVSDATAVWVSVFCGSDNVADIRAAAVEKQQDKWLRHHDRDTEWCASEVRDD
jgi:hypothetical protein